ncbi:MAG: FAD:protein FMN transferase [Bacteroidales bacterium]|nr:FAD:protein FMN transferase [Bacteroidales bacterium]
MKHNIVFPVLFIAFLSMLASCARTPEWRRAEGVIWGTEYHIVYHSDKDLADSALAQMNRVDMGVSAFNPRSNLSMINAGKTDSVGEEFTEIFMRSKRLNAISRGIFDPTVAPLVDLWGFGKRTPSDSAPDPASVARMLQRVGIDSCRIDAQGHIVRKHPDTEFDFSAIAKGYGVDCVAEMLERNGCTDYMVEIGGEVRVGGRNEHGALWRIQIDDPNTSGIAGHERLAVVELTDCAVATSGNYRNVRTLADGRKVWHTISPRTGYPVETNIQSVTVVAPKCIVADALATTCMAGSVDEVRRIMRSYMDVSALLVVRGRGDSMRFVTFGPDVFNEVR